MRCHGPRKKGATNNSKISLKLNGTNSFYLANRYGPFGLENISRHIFGSWRGVPENVLIGLLTSESGTSPRDSRLREALFEQSDRFKFSAKAIPRIFAGPADNWL